MKIGKLQTDHYKDKCIITSKNKLSCITTKFIIILHSQLMVMDVIIVATYALIRKDPQKYKVCVNQFNPHICVFGLVFLVRLNDKQHFLERTLLQWT